VTAVKAVCQDASMDYASELQDVVAVTVTPFDADGGVDEAAHAAVVARMVEAGVRVVTVNGNTGEFYALSQAELDRCVARTVAAAGDALVVAGVGFDVDRAVALARSAQRAGARAVMVHQPVHPYQSAAGWVEYHRVIADAVPELGVLCYVRDPRVGAALLTALADACPNVVGVKYAVPDVLKFAATVAGVPAGRLVWLCGLAESWAPFYWLAGARGFTSGLATIEPRLSLALLARLRAGEIDDLMRIWAALRPLEDLRARDASADNVSVVKEALAQQGICGRGVRPPSSELGEEDRATVGRILSDWKKIN
jgi:4-hydroxy-tetrahydrodipicolinate synthase